MAIRKGSPIRKKKKQPHNVPSLFKSLRSGEKTALAKAITLIESSRPTDIEDAEDLVTQCLRVQNESIRIGITGVPGVGKSTFIEAFGSYLTQNGKKVAVLTVDPSSSISKGSILGDKTRMENLSKDPNAFIRPSPAQDSLGGVAKRTRETIILCEAAGFDIILVETVGVGQSETLVHSMVDFFLLLKLAGAGDELQGVKRGIMEMADAIVINKADGENIKAARLAKAEFNRALHLYPKKDNGWAPKTVTCSALHNQGVTEIWETISSYVDEMKENSYFFAKRNEQNTNWMLETIKDALQQDFFGDSKVKEQLKLQKQALEENKTTPFEAARFLLDLKSQS